MKILSWTIRLAVTGFLSVTTTLAIAFLQFLTHTGSDWGIWKEFGFPFTIYSETRDRELTRAEPKWAMVNCIIYFCLFLLLHLLSRRLIQPKLAQPKNETDLID